MELRVVDFGKVSGLRSQTLWHAIAYGVSAGAPPTLSFMVPGSPYVSIGYHSDISAVDLNACEATHLPVYRRMVGGGPVYLDSDQLFFQITIPASMAPAVRSVAVRELLTPAVEAFRESGVPAELDDVNEIVLGDRKICGHAAGQIGDAIIVVGNLITSFDHEAAASIANTPGPPAASMFRRFLARYVTAVVADPGVFIASAISAYAASLGLTPSLEPGDGEPPRDLTDLELAKLEELDDLLADPVFVAGRGHIRTLPWRVKVKSGVWVLGHQDDDATAVVGLVDDVIASAHLEVRGGDAAALGEDLIGSKIERAAELARTEGRSGVAVARLLEAMAKG
jgi:lipoate-protein ligase A